MELRGFWCGTERFFKWNWGGWTEGSLVWNWGLCWTEGFSVLNRGVFGVELGGFGVKLRDLLNFGVYDVELRNFEGWKGLALFCGTDVLNWGVWNWGGPNNLIQSLLLYLRSDFACTSYSLNLTNWEPENTGTGWFDPLPILFHLRHKKFKTKY